MVDEKGVGIAVSFGLLNRFQSFGFGAITPPFILVMIVQFDLKGYYRVLLGCRAIVPSSIRLLVLGVHLHWESLGYSHRAVYMMGSREKVAMCKVWLGFGLLMAGFISWTGCIDLQALSGNDIRCLSVDKDACNKDEGSWCEWCELPQECYHREFVKKLGASCNGSQRRQLKDVQDCADIAAEEKCLSLDHCRWCRSDALDDGCFRAWEARKLPVQIFECSRGL